MRSADSPEERIAMATPERDEVRSAMLARPAVRSSTAMRKLEASLRRLGADDRTIAEVTGRSTRRRARPLAG